MDSFGYQINETCDEDTINLDFMNRSEFGSGDVEQQLFESQENLLSAIENINEIPDSLSYLNPVNHILNDIGECGKTYLEEMSVSQSAFCSKQFNSLWNSCEVRNSNGDITVNSGKQSAAEDGTGGTEYCNIDQTTGDSILLPENSAEFTSGSFLRSEHTSNPWLLSLEQKETPCVTQVPAVGIATSMSVPQFQALPNSDTAINSTDSLPLSTILPPTNIDDNHFVHQAIVPVLHDFPVKGSLCGRGSLLQSNGIFIVPSTCRNPLENTEMGSVEKCLLKANEFCTSGSSSNCDKKNFLNIISFPSHQVQHKISSSMADHISSVDCLHWATVVPRTQLIQPPEIIVMQPLRTRKLVIPRHITIHNNSNPSLVSVSEYIGNSPINIRVSEEGKYGKGGNEMNRNPEKDLFENFDINSVNIPVINECSRSKDKSENRRKQKLHIIPGSENVAFEIQNKSYCDSQENVKSFSEYFQPSIDPYPEIELPELDEIFRRKKKSMFSNKSSQLRSVELTKTKIYQSEIQQPIQESSASFEEKVSVSIAVRKARSNLLIDKTELVYSSGSEESDENSQIINTQKVKSFKCKKCQKMFKTTRSLAVHTKHCAIDSRDESTNVNKIEEISRSPYTTEHMLINKKSSCSSKLKEIPQIVLEANVQTSTSPKKKVRPTTRLQTRRSTDRSLLFPNMK